MASENTIPHPPNIRNREIRGHHVKWNHALGGPHVHLTDGTEDTAIESKDVKTALPRFAIDGVKPVKGQQGFVEDEKGAAAVKEAQEANERVTDGTKTPVATEVNPVTVPAPVEAKPKTKTK